MLRATILGLLLMLSGCKTMSDTYDRWFGKPQPAVKPAELVALTPTASLRVLWQASVGDAGKSMFFPQIDDKVVYAVGVGGQIAGFEIGSGAQTTRFDAGQPLSAGVGAGAGLIVVAGAKGEVLAFERSGKPLWKIQLSGEILAPPAVSGSIVVVRSGDGRIYGLNAANGSRKWVYQRATPPLTLRSFAGVLVYRGGVFAGLTGGRMAAMALETGNLGWEGIVATPRGTTELERVADVTSLPVVDERQACAVAYQGRVACFDVLRGTTIWARDLSSVSGMGADERNLYITDDRNAIVALSKTNGASVWKQDKLSGRGVTAPLAIGRYVAVGDFQGYVHLLSRDDGAFAARIATGGSPILAPPLALDASTFLVQAQSGSIYAIRIE